MSALKSLSDNSNNRVIFVLVSIDYFLFQVEVFMFLSMMSHFQCVQDILDTYHARKLLILIQICFIGKQPYSNL